MNFLELWQFGTTNTHGAQNARTNNFYLLMRVGHKILAGVFIYFVAQNLSDVFLT